jgi:hypothetical protein
LSEEGPTITATRVVLRGLLTAAWLLVERGAEASRQTATTLCLHEALPSRSEFVGPTTKRFFEKFGADNAIRPEVAEILTKLAPCS